MNFGNYNKKIGIPTSLEFTKEEVEEKEKFVKETIYPIILEQEKNEMYFFFYSYLQSKFCWKF